jgi:hypothetical protein
MEVVEDANQHANTRAFLQGNLDDFMQIKQTDTSYRVVPFGTNGDNFKNAQQRSNQSR